MSSERNKHGEANEAVLLLDADPGILERLERVIQRRLGYSTRAAYCCDEALREARSRAFRLAVIDVDLPDKTFDRAIGKLKALHPGLHVIMTSSDYSKETERLARSCGLVLYMTKPLDLDLLATAVRTAWQSSARPGRPPKPQMPQEAAFA